MAETHTDLIGLSDRELLLRAGNATHQHYKGGLYRMIGYHNDADTDDAVRDADGFPRVLYEHVYPHARVIWVRDESEFFGTVTVDGVEVPRFRRIRA